MSDSDPQAPRPDAPPVPPVPPPPPAGPAASAGNPGSSGPAGYPGPGGYPGSAGYPGSTGYPGSAGYPGQPGYPAGYGPTGQQAPQPGAPGYPSQHPYGYVGGYAYPPTARTNVLSVLSLVASLTGILMILPFIGSVAAVIMGHISLSQLKTSGEKGRGMALAGTIIGWIGIGLLVLFVAFLVIGLTIATSGSRYAA